MLPTIPIEPTASQVNGFIVKDEKLARKKAKGDGGNFACCLSEGRSPPVLDLAGKFGA